MKVNVKGTVLENLVENLNFNGKKRKDYSLGYFNKGERVNLDVNVKPATYSEVKTGQVIELNDITVTSYKDVLCKTIVMESIIECLYSVDDLQPILESLTAIMIYLMHLFRK